MSLENLSDRERIQIFVALENPIRYNMIIFLSNSGGESKHSEIASKLKLDELEYVHHANLLLEAGLTKPVYYSHQGKETLDTSIEITEKAKMVLDFLNKD